MRTVLLSLSVIFLGVLLLLAAAAQQTAPSDAAPQATATQPEKHLRNIKQLTFGGQNAEAYFSVDGKKLIFQSTREPVKCDQIFIMVRAPRKTNAAGAGPAGRARRRSRAFARARQL